MTYAAILALAVPNTRLELAAYVLGGTDLCLLINAKDGAGEHCLGRFVIEDLCTFTDFARLQIGEHRLTPEPQR